MRTFIKIRYLIAIISVLIQLNDCANILGIVPSVPRSHSMLTQTFFKELIKRGHEVTVVSAYPLKTAVNNYTDIVLADLRKKYIDNVERPDLFKTKGRWIVFDMYTSIFVPNYMTKDAIEDPVIEEVKKMKNNFDVVIVELFFNEVFFALAHHFNVPLIVFSTTGHSIWTEYLSGNPTPYAYVPDCRTGYTDNMSFMERVYNTKLSILNSLLFNYVHLPKQEALRQKHFPGTPHLSEIMKSTSLIIVNDDIGLTYPKAIMPNVIEVGGYHVKPPKQLPANLKILLDQAKHGVIYFSMGTVLKSKNFPKELQTIFLNEFRKLKQLVLWKFEDTNLNNKPDNVIIQSWFPQSDILGHPNIKLFITHGGILSTFESLHRAVPILGIPIFGDQKMNLGKVQAVEFGLLLEYNNITAQSVSWALNELLNNPKYETNVKTRSSILKDKAIDHMDKASYYIDYVIRHKGAKHLKTAALRLNWYQQILLDARFT